MLLVACLLVAVAQVSGQTVAGTVAATTAKAGVAATTAAAAATAAKTTAAATTAAKVAATPTQPSGEKGVEPAPTRWITGQTTLPAAFQGPGSVLVDTTGNVFVVNQDRRSIVRVNAHDGMPYFHSHVLLQHRFFRAPHFRLGLILSLSLG
jgi:hypothetical protein